LQEKNTRLTARWENEEGGDGAIKKLQEQLDQKQVELEQAQRQGNWEVGRAHSYGDMRDLKAPDRAGPEAPARLTKSGRRW
jgi:hypothetical protein